MKKKRFTGIILAIMMLSMTVFTGCSLVTRNWERYYNAVVSTITDKDDHKIEITKRELISAYNSYGYYYEQYYNKTRKEAIELTLAQLESRKLTIKAAEEKFTQDNGQVLSDKEKTYLWQQTNDALETNFKSYVDQVTGTTSSEEEEDDSQIKFTPYEKQAELKYYKQDVLDKDGNVVKTVEVPKIEKTAPLDELLSDFDYNPSMKKDIGDDEDKNQIYQNLLTMVNSGEGGKVYSQAYSEYKKALKQSEEGLKFKENKDADLFAREIDRIYKINYENFMVEKYTDSFKDKTTDSNVSVNKMLELYSNKVLNSYTQYVLEEDEDYESDVLSDLSKIYYFKTGDNATKFYTVSHILFKYTDEQTAIYNKAKTELESGKIDIDTYNKRIGDLTVKPIVREKDEYGVYTEIDKKDYQAYENNVYDLYDHIKVVIDQAGDPIKKAEAFNQLIYKYNQDPGIMSAEYNYVMGVNKSQAEGAGDDLITLEDGRQYKKYSQMVEEFTLAGAELYNDGYGQIGDISDLVATENGLHILMYMGPCQNYFDSIIDGFNNGQSFALSEGAISTLYTARLNPGVDKTIFDVLYEELNTDNFSTFENANISILREGCKFTHHESEYSDLFNA